MTSYIHTVSFFLAMVTYHIFGKAKYPSLAHKTYIAAFGLFNLCCQPILVLKLTHLTNKTTVQLFDCPAVLSTHPSHFNMYVLINELTINWKISSNTFGLIGCF